MIRIQSLLLALVLAGAVFTGCDTLRRAHEAQDEVVAKSTDDLAPAAQTKVNLKGATLARLVDFALTNRPSVVSARLAVETARLTLRQLAADAPLASATPWTAPKLSLSGKYSESSPGGTYTDPDWRTHGNPTAALSLELLVWDFGRYDAKAKAQSERVIAAEQDLVKAGYVVFEEVATTYFRLQEAGALLAVARTNEMQYADHLRLAEERLRAGEANSLDVLRARVDLAKARQKTVEQSTLVETCGARLVCALGIDAPRGTYETVVGAPAATLGTVFQGFARSRCGVDGAFDFAHTNAPAMRVARARLRAASHAVDYAVADLLPNVTATASLSWTNPYWYWGWGVGAAQSLFQGFRKTTAIDLAVVEMRSAEATLDTTSQSLSVLIEVAIASRDNAVKALESARATQRSAKENLEMVRQQLSLGEVSRIDLSDAIASHSSAIGDCITAFYAGQVAEATLFATLGRAPVYVERTLGGR